MLGKILKYDIKSMGKPLIMVYLADVCLALVSKLFNFLGTKLEIIKYLAAFIDMFFLFALVATILITLVVSIRRFYTSMLRDEGYLTHTLPVKKSTHINSKIISSLLFLVISIAVIIGCLAIAHFDYLSLFWNAVVTGLSLINMPVLPLICAIIVLGYSIYFMMGYTAMSIANLHNTNKLVFSAIYAIALYMVSQFVNGIILVIFLLLNKSAFNTDFVIQNESALVYQLLAVFGTVLVLTLAVYYIITNIIMKKKLNLE